MNIGVLALQGAFAEQIGRLEALGLHCFPIRRRQDLQTPMDGLVLPGGESTVQGKLLRDLGLLQPLRQRITEGLPTLGTCAGLILLAGDIGEESPHFGTLPVQVRRNAYGRQLGSFQTEGVVKGVGMVPMTFIRAPYIVSASPGVEVLARVDGRIVAIQQGSQLGLAFHPELTDSDAIFLYFRSLLLQHCQCA